MRRQFSFLGIVLIFGCGQTHYDESLHFTVSGVVTCDGRCPSETSIRLLNTGLDQRRAVEKAPEIANTKLGAEEKFLLIASYGFGYDGPPAINSRDRYVTLEVDVPRCAKSTTILRLSEFRQDKHGFIRDLGKVGIVCSK